MPNISEDFIKKLREIFLTISKKEKLKIRNNENLPKDTIKALQKELDEINKNLYEGKFILNAKLS